MVNLVVTRIIQKQIKSSVFARDLEVEITLSYTLIVFIM